MNNTAYAEAQYIDAILADNSIIDEHSIYETDFVTADNRALFAAIRREIEKGKTVDSQLLFDLVASGELHVSTSRIADLNPMTAANSSHYAERIKTESLRRMVRKIKEPLSKIETEDPQEVVEAVEKQISALHNRDKSSRVQEVSETISNTIDYIEQRINAKGELPGITTGYKKLDHIVGGFQAGHEIIVGARTSVGKSTFAINMATRQAKSGFSVGFVSCEMDVLSLELKIISNLANIPLNRIRAGKLGSRELEEISDVAKIIYGLPIQWYFAKNSEISHVKSKIRHMVRRGARIVYVDYLTLLQYTDKNLTRPERVGLISKQIKHLAEELQIPIVALSQVGRQAGEREPTISDLRQSGEVEEDADSIILLHRENLGAPDTKVIVGKNRGGAVGATDFYFDLHHQRFSEVIKGAA